MVKLPREVLPRVPHAHLVSIVQAPASVPHVLAAPTQPQDGTLALIVLPVLSVFPAEVAAPTALRVNMPTPDSTVTTVVLVNTPEGLRLHAAALLLDITLAQGRVVTLPALLASTLTPVQVAALGALLVDTTPPPPDHHAPTARRVTIILTDLARTVARHVTDALPASILRRVRLAVPVALLEVTALPMVLALCPNVLPVDTLVLVLAPVRTAPLACISPTPAELAVLIAPQDMPALALVLRTALLVLRESTPLVLKPRLVPAVPVASTHPLRPLAAAPLVLLARAPKLVPISVLAAKLDCTLPLVPINVKLAALERTPARVIPSVPSVPLANSIPLVNRRGAALVLPAIFRLLVWHLAMPVLSAHTDLVRAPAQLVLPESTAVPHGTLALPAPLERPHQQALVAAVRALPEPMPTTASAVIAVPRVSTPRPALPHVLLPLPATTPL